MHKKFRFLTVLAVCVMVLSCFSVTAFAYADDTDQNLPVTEATQPEQQPETTPAPEKPKGEPIDDEGNAYTRDLLYDKATNKQFITIQTKSGNTFFIVIDYDAPINEDEEQYQTYFLNMVDESDLLALLDDDTTAALTTCTEFRLCTAIRNRRNDLCKLFAVKVKCKFQAIAASISDKLSLVISLPILDVLVPCLDIKARGFQVFFVIPNADCGTLQSFDSLGSFRHCTVIGFR